MTNLNKINFHGFFLFFAIIICFIYTTGHLTNPYIRHDDWEFMLSAIPPELPHHGTAWDKTLSEGRWVNYYWSSFVASKLSIHANYLLFIIGYSLFSWMTSYFLINLQKNNNKEYSSNNTYILIGALLIFFNPIYADLSLWPATLAPSVWLGFLFVLILALTYYHSNGINKKICFLMLIFSLLTMSYAPLIASLFLILSISAKNYKELLKFSILYYVFYVIGVIAIHVLNYSFHDYFGVQVADWRHPNPIKNINDIFENFDKARHSFGVFYRENKIYYLIGLVLSVLAFVQKNRRAMQLTVALLVVLFLECALLIYTGVDYVARSTIFIWMFFSLLILLTLQFNLTNNNYLKNKHIFYTSLVTLMGIFIVNLYNGIENWNGFYRYEARTAQYESSIANLLSLQSRKEVLVCHYEKIVPNANITRELKALSLSVYKRSEIILKSYNGEECHQLPDQFGVFNLNNKTFLNIF